MTENRHAYGHSGGYAAEPKTGYGDVAADQSKTGYGSVETEPPATGYGLHNSPVRFILKLLNIILIGRKNTKIRSKFIYFQNYIIS